MVLPRHSHFGYHQRRAKTAEITTTSTQLLPP